jgi:hypothetical protein
MVYRRLRQVIRAPTTSYARQLWVFAVLEIKLVNSGRSLKCVFTRARRSTDMISNQDEGLIHYACCGDGSKP